MFKYFNTITINLLNQTRRRLGVLWLFGDALLFLGDALRFLGDAFRAFRKVFREAVRFLRVDLDLEDDEDLDLDLNNDLRSALLFLFMRLFLLFMR